MPALNSAPEKEFIRAYRRLQFSTKGIKSPKEFNERMTDEIKRDIREKKEVTSKQRKRYLQKCISGLKNLRSSEFAIRVFEEAYSNPQGYISLSLKYGQPSAKRILLERFRKKPKRYRII